MLLCIEEPISPLNWTLPACLNVDSVPRMMTAILNYLPNDILTRLTGTMAAALKPAFPRHRVSAVAWRLPMAENSPNQGGGIDKWALRQILSGGSTSLIERPKAASVHLLASGCRTAWDWAEQLLDFKILRSQVT